MPTIFTNRPCLLSFTPVNVLRPYGGKWLTLFVTIVPVSAHPTPLHQVAMLSRYCLSPASRKCQLLRWMLPMPVTSSASHCPTGKTTDALVQVGGGLFGFPICHPGPLLCAVVELCALPSDHVQKLWSSSTERRREKQRKEQLNLNRNFSTSERAEECLRCFGRWRRWGTCCGKPSKVYSLADRLI